MSTPARIGRTEWWLLPEAEMMQLLVDWAVEHPRDAYGQYTAADRLRIELGLTESHISALRCGQLACIYWLAQEDPQSVGDTPVSWQRRAAVKMAGQPPTALTTAIANASGHHAHYQEAIGKRALVNAIPPIDDLYLHAATLDGLVDWAVVGDERTEARRRRADTVVSPADVTKEIRRDVSHGRVVNVTERVAETLGPHPTVRVDAHELAALLSHNIAGQLRRNRFHRRSFIVDISHNDAGDTVARPLVTLGDLRALHIRQRIHARDVIGRYRETRQFLNGYANEPDDTPIVFDRRRRPPDPGDEV